MCEKRAYFHSVISLHTGGTLEVVHDETHCIFKHTLFRLGGEGGREGREGGREREGERGRERERRQTENERKGERRREKGGGGREC